MRVIPNQFTVKNVMIRYMTDATGELTWIFSCNQLGEQDKTVICAAYRMLV